MKNEQGATCIQLYSIFSDHETRRTLRQYVKKVKTPYIDLDPKVKVLEFIPEDMMAQAAARDTKNSMTTSKSQLQQQPSASGSQATGQQVSGQSASDLKESSHQSISEKTLSVSGMLKPESEMSLRDEAQQVEEDLPEDLLKPLKILERLLAQSNYHKQQVRYKDYPFNTNRKAPEEKKEGPTEYEQRITYGIDSCYRKSGRNRSSVSKRLSLKVLNSGYISISQANEGAGNQTFIPI